MSQRRVAGLIFVFGNFALLIAGLIAALFVTTRFGGTATLQFDREGDAVTLPDFGERGSHIANYRHGETTTFSFPLRNTGMVSARVTGVRLNKDRLSMLTIESATVDGAALPVSLDGGEEATVAVTARYGNCRYYHEREVELVEAVTVEASVFGVGVTRRVPLDHDLVIRSPMIVDCPDRTLTRGDDVRPPPKN